MQKVAAACGITRAPGMTKRVLSLFTGAGGLDCGFIQSGFRIAEAVEADRIASETYRRNFASNCSQADLRQYIPTTTDVDVVIAGPPCQGFSSVGKNSSNDSRNDLLLIAATLAINCNPEIIVLENVPSLTNVRNRKYLDRVTAHLSDSGYFVDILKIAAHEAGLPQKRIRLFIVAVRNRPFNCQISKHLKSVKLADVLRNLRSEDSHHRPIYHPEGSRHRAIAKKIGPGQKLCNVRAGSKSIPTWQIPDVFGKISSSELKVLEAIRMLRRRNRKRPFGDADPVSQRELNDFLDSNTEDLTQSLIEKRYLRTIDGYFDLRNTFNGKYRRLDLNSLSPTVDTRFGSVELFLHPTEDRAMTVREAARIQGFDDSFWLPEQRSQAFKLIGNAVPPPVARLLASELLTFL